MKISTSFFFFFGEELIIDSKVYMKMQSIKKYKKAMSVLFHAF